MDTPEFITELKPDDLIVVGTNELGSHGGGLALYAKEHFGLKDGDYSGISGQCWCVPTLDESFKKVELIRIKQNLIALVMYAKAHPEKTTYLTKIGMGIAGFTLEEIKSALPKKFPKNVILPIEFKI